ncbi:MAG: ComEC/Rec2 family competence protein [Candidatus Zixiibacteriota bacterium]
MFSFRYPAVVILTAIIIGTLAGRFIDISYLAILGLTISLFLTMFFIVRSDSQTKLAVSLLILFFGIATMNASQHFHPSEERAIAQFADRVDGEPIRLFSRIDKWPVLKQHRTMIICEADSVIVHDTIFAASGRLMLWIDRVTTEFMLGDRISVVGRLEAVKPSSALKAFDFGKWLVNQGIQAQMRVDDPAEILIDESRRGLFAQSVDRLRKWISNVFVTYLDEVPAAMSAGYLIGETRHIPEDVYLAFRTTGTMHLLAVSGSNVALVLLVALFILKPFPLNRFVRLGFLLGLIILFSHLSYNQPSVVRASVMAMLVLIGRTLYRRVDLHNIIGAAAVILILYNPSNLFDVGFQLSFAVTWGLVLFLPIFHEIVMLRVSKEWQRYMLLIVFCSVIASAMATPITVYYFGTLSVVTVFSNLLVVPLVSLAVIGIVILLLIAAIYPPVAFIIAKPLNVLLDVTNSIVIWFDAVNPSLESPISLSGIEVFILLIGATLLFLSFKYLFIRRLFVFYALLMILAVNVAGVIIHDKQEGEVVCFNTGIVRGAFIDIAGGLLVIESDRYDRNDVLNNDMLPYIMREYDYLPAYILFYEAEYIVQERIYEMTEQYPDNTVLPVHDSDTISGGSLWSCRNRNEHISGHAISGPELILLPWGFHLRTDSTSLTYIHDLHLYQKSEFEISENLDVAVIQIGPAEVAADLGSVPPADQVLLMKASSFHFSNMIDDNELIEKLGCAGGSVSLISVDELYICRTGYID